MKTLKSNKRCRIATKRQCTINDETAMNDKLTTTARNDGQKGIKGFTLVELVITIAIVIILAVVSVPIYQGYVRKAKMAEGYAVLGTILSSQKAYYSEYGNFYSGGPNNTFWQTCYEPVLGIDARGNKYFTFFHDGYTGPTPGIGGNWEPKINFYAEVHMKPELISDCSQISLWYNITSGATVAESNY